MFFGSIGNGQRNGGEYSTFCPADGADLSVDRRRGFGTGYGGSRVPAYAIVDLRHGENSSGSGAPADLQLLSADDDQRNLGRGKTGTFGGFTGKADRMDPEGFPGCGHRNQSVPVADHTGGGFLEKFRSGEGCLGIAGDRKCCGWGSGAGAGIGSCDPE